MIILYYTPDPREILALEIIQGLADLDIAPKQIGSGMRERTESELEAFDAGYTAALLKLHSLGLDEAAEALIDASTDLDVTIDLDVVQAYCEAFNV